MPLHQFETQEIQSIVSKLTESKTEFKPIALYKMINDEVYLPLRRIRDRCQYAWTDPPIVPGDMKNLCRAMQFWMASFRAHGQASPGFVQWDNSVDRADELHLAFLEYAISLLLSSIALVAGAIVSGVRTDPGGSFWVLQAVCGVITLLASLNCFSQSYASEKIFYDGIWDLITRSDDLLSVPPPVSPRDEGSAQKDNETAGVTSAVHKNGTSGTVTPIGGGPAAGGVVPSLYLTPSVMFGKARGPIQSLTRGEAPAGVVADIENALGAHEGESPTYPGQEEQDESASTGYYLRSMIPPFLSKWSETSARPKKM